VTNPSAIPQQRVGDASIRSSIWQLAAIACATLVILGLLLAWCIERNRESNAWMVRTQTIMRELGALTNDFVEAETGQRGYLLTQQAGYLSVYWQALADHKTRFARLNRLISYDGERRTLARLSQIFKDKAQELDQTIQLARAGELAQSLAIVQEGRGRRYSLEFHRLSNEIAHNEAAMLALHQAAVDHELRNIQIGMATGGILAILLIIASAARTVTQLESRARALIRSIEAIVERHLNRPLGAEARDGNNKLVAALNDMADGLLLAKQDREIIQAELATSHTNLLTEVAERTAAQKQLSISVGELKRSNEELDNFAYCASHDLKAPLRGIRNLTEWVAADVKDIAGQDTLENLALVRNRVERLDMLLDSLLLYARVGRIGGTVEDIDVAQMIGEIADYIAPRPGFTVVCKGKIPDIRTTKAPLEQVLRNLIANGLKHHDAGAGTVTVSARDIGNFVEFRVEDDGPGVPLEFHERIFQMFQTLKPRDEVEGSGMGLAIVKKSVEGHGGAIWVESNPPRRGTAFIFTWEKERLAKAA
jgi:signal transduction histidine kinase